MTETMSSTPDRSRSRPGEGARRTLRFLAVLAVLAGGVFLLARELATWASARPITALLGCAAVIPVVVVFVRGKPRTRELRRAARAGMAEVDAEAEALDQKVAVGGREAPELLPDGASCGPPPSARPYDAMDADEFEHAIARLCERDGCSGWKSWAAPGTSAPMSSPAPPTADAS